MMKQIFERVRRHFPFLGERAVTELELFEYCERRGVDVVFTPQIRKGVYVRHELGTDHIFLNSTLHGSSLLYVFAHELGHYMLHVPTRARGITLSFDGERCNQQKHNEAETAAALLMFTFADAEQALYDGLGVNDERLDTLIKRRINYFGKFRN